MLVEGMESLQQQNLVSQQTERTTAYMILLMTFILLTEPSTTPLLYASETAMLTASKSFFMPATNECSSLYGDCSTVCSQPKKPA